MCSRSFHTTFSLSPPPSLCSAPSLSSKSRLASAVTSAPVHLFSLISSVPESSFSLFTPLISTFPSLSLAPTLLPSPPALLLYSSGLACPRMRWLFYLPLRGKGEKGAVGKTDKQIKYKNKFPMVHMLLFCSEETMEYFSSHSIFLTFICVCFTTL